MAAAKAAASTPKSQRPAYKPPEGMTRVASPFEDSGDGWYQYDLEEKPEDLPPWYGFYLGSFLFKPKNNIRGAAEDRLVHKFKLLEPVDARGAKGNEKEGELTTLKPGQILLVYDKWELGRKLEGKIGGRVWCKPLEGKDIGNKEPMWQFDVFASDVPVQAAPTAPRRAAQPENAPETTGEIPF